MLYKREDYGYCNSVLDDSPDSGRQFKCGKWQFKCVQMPIQMCPQVGHTNMVKMPLCKCPFKCDNCEAQWLTTNAQVRRLRTKTL